MANRFVVSTECPNCGAPLDFDEGSRAIQCGHCRSNLLVTGRKQVLSYYIRPTLPKDRAIGVAAVAQRKEGERWRAVKRHLYFIPYYRLTGDGFIWEKASPKPRPTAEELLGSTAVEFRSMGGGPAMDLDLDSVIESGIHFLMETFRGGRKTSREEKRFFAAMEAPENKTAEADKSPPHRVIPNEERDNFVEDNDQIQFRDRHIEKNFLACDLDKLGLYSLGIRPAVLRLDLFRRKALEELGSVVGVSTAPEAALAHGMMTAVENVLCRQVLSHELSVIYFPFWVVEMQLQGQTRLTVIDAVSEKVIKLDAPPSLYSMLDRKVTSDPPVVGFRPLTCPNCGWDLPADPYNIIFFCSSCRRAWQIRGQELSQVSYGIAERPDTGDQEPVKYLPFWVIQSETEKRAFRFFLPAFRYRRLKFLNDLAMKISRLQPAYSIANGEAPEVHGGYYDQEDAVMLAQFVSAGLTSGSADEMRSLQPEKFDAKAASLICFPFVEKADSYRDPFLGFPIPKNLLL